MVARADERLAHAYEQIARADEQLARVNEQISRMEYDAGEKKAVNKLRRPSHGRPALRGVIGLALTACICFAAFASQSYGETTKLMISRWVPQLAASLPPAKPELAAQQSLPVVRVAAADATVSQISPSAQSAPQEAASAPIPPEVTQSLQTMARDLASVQQEIEQLKASQQELARENAGIAEQLKASQEQIARAISSASEQNQRPKPSVVATSANPPPRVATPARKPASTLPPKQAGAQAPVQLQPRQQ
ncbi:hypothetical protein IVB30_14815 [Bradyrhizobium sp. 200]|uniref:hypothetical protein n=1 Tax=Bradyrhizobium sp. 200 TaxID=2782665 RepID=UPI001FFFC1ED|nr:hypothetical protein [Bradyrhizobium sp. 200]UPJ52503.1 hypothetical protein IVB30_14815 [Bradyrhizobium sp. 200]